MKNITPKTSLNLSLKLVFILFAMIAVAGAANAATITVTNTNDSGAGSLRQALLDVSDGDTIDFAVTGAITLTTASLTVEKDVTISGPGADKLAVQRSADAGTPAFRIFSIGSISTGTIRTVTISGLTITNGAAAFGGGILNLGILTLTNSTVSGNRSDPSGGAGIANANTMILNNSTVSDNSAAVGGGGIYTFGESLSINNSTISGNSATGGGGIYSPNARVILKNSTITGNSASTVAGGGIYNPAGPVNVANTIIAGNTSGIGPDVAGNVTSKGYNLIGNASGSTGFSAVGDQTGTIASPIDPKLGPLAYNGGPTKTHALQPGSPAIDAGGTTILTTDQRGTGFARIVGGTSDIGAYEFGAELVDTDGDGVPDWLDTCPATPHPEKIAFTSQRDGNFEIYVMNADGSGQTNLTNDPANDSFPSFSPDGSRIVFASVRDGNSEIYVMNADGSGQTRLTNNEAIDLYPSFSPDGSRIVFMSNRDGNDEIYVMNANGSGQTNLTNNSATDSYPSFSPNDRIAFSSARDGNFEIYTINADGSGLTRLTNNAAGDWSPSFSPDGTRIALVSNRDGNEEIYVMNANGTGQTRLTNNTLFAADDMPTFSPDGTKIAFTSLRDGNFEIYVMNADGSGQTNLTNNSLDDFATSWRGQADACENTAPVANDDAYSTNEDTSLTATAPGVLANDTGADGFTLAAAIVSGPSHGSLTLNADGSFSYTPDANYNGSDTFTYKANDGSLDSNVATVTITVNPMNDAPVANADAYSTNEDTPLTVPAPGVLGNDSDADSDTLTVGAYSQPLHGTLTLDANGSFTYTPAANYNGADSFTYRASDGTVNSNLATVRITVHPVNDAPMVSAAPKTQSGVQYSDAIRPLTVTAYDSETPASALTIAFSYTKDAGASQPGLPAGMVQGGTAGAWTVSGVAGVPQGNYVITAWVTDTGDNGAIAATSTDSFTIVVTRENAVASPRSSNPVSMLVASAGGTATGTTAQICFDITEPSDGSAGDTSLINSATVLINPVGGGSGAGTITPSAVEFLDGGVGQARTACFTLTMTNTPVNVYELELVIGGNYYTGSGTTAFTVFDPSAGFVSGGGWIINPNTGYRANYGVNVKYLKNGNAQGSLLYVEHRPDGDYKVKSTSLNSKGGFAILPITGGAEADITGKANFGVNDLFTGNYSFIARVIDKGTPGTSDQFGLKLIDPIGQIVTSHTFDPVALGGGNNQVPKK